MILLLRFPFVFDPAEKKKRADEGEPTANANGPRADSNGGPSVSFCFPLDQVSSPTIYQYFNFI